MSPRRAGVLEPAVAEPAPIAVLAERVLILRHGRLVAKGAKAEVVPFGL